MVNHKSNLCAHRSFANNLKETVTHFGVNNNLLIKEMPFIKICDEPPRDISLYNLNFHRTIPTNCFPPRK